MIAEYPDLEAGEIARLTLQGAVSPREMVESAFDAIERLNPHLNAVVHRARASAESQLAAGLAPGPLYGVPVLLKDLGCPADGVPTTYGSRLFAGAPAWSHDCVLVARLKAAGAVIIGRTTSCEFGISLVTEPDAYGATRNPYGPGVGAGGSSGGSAAAVASGMVPIAHATDGCGSIRVPAAHCGLFGLKPSRARISFGPDAGESWAGMSVAFGLTRSVGDAAVLLDVLSGPAPGDPYAAPGPARPFDQEVGAPCGRLRIGLVTAAPGGVSVHADCQQAVAAAARLCSELGHDLEPCVLPFDVDEALPHLRTIWATQLWTLVEPRYRALGREPDGWGMEPVSWALAQSAHRCTALDQLAAVRYLHRVGRDFASALGGLDVVLSPVTAGPPPPLGVLPTDHGDLDGYLQRLFELNPFTAPFNVTGWPAMSAPLHRNSGGLPIGVQFAAPFGEEALLLRLAAQLETASPWRRRTPRRVELPDHERSRAPT